VNESEEETTVPPEFDTAARISSVVPGVNPGIVTVTRPPVSVPATNVVGEVTPYLTPYDEPDEAEYAYETTIEVPVAETNVSAGGVAGRIVVVKKRLDDTTAPPEFETSDWNTYAVPCVNPVIATVTNPPDRVPGTDTLGVPTPYFTEYDVSIPCEYAYLSVTDVLVEETIVGIAGTKGSGASEDTTNCKVEGIVSNDWAGSGTTLASGTNVSASRILLPIVGTLPTAEVNETTPTPE
jgi:hypothetical protein